MRNIKICMAQLAVVPRKPWENLKKAKDAIVKANADGADIVVFSEMFLPGYLIGDHWERPAFIRDCEDAALDLCRFSKNYPDMAIFIGCVVSDFMKRNEDGRIRKYNTALVFKNGYIRLNAVKTLQPNYREFDDDRHFYSNRKLSIDNRTAIPDGTQGMVIPDFTNNVVELEINKHSYKIGVILCEDGWKDDYTIDPIGELAKKNVDLVVNISCSPYTFGKNGKRDRMFGGQAKKHETPIVYVNNVGIQNNGKNVFTFDGNSCIYDKHGSQLNPYDYFEEGVATVEIDLNAEFGMVLNTAEDIETLWKAMLYATREFCNRLGVKRVVIGASGGIDSALSAVLFAKVLGSDNVTLVNMPSRYNSDLTKNAAKDLAAKLGCKYLVIPIEDSVILTDKQMKEAGLELSEFMLQNVQARDRSSRILSAVASAVGGVFTCNANKSEAMVGYTTLYGDLGGFFAPLGDLWKTQVYALARHINYIYGELIPADTINVVPSAELSASQDVTKGKGDPIRYFYHDKLFASWIERWDRATPEECLEWYLNGTLAKEIGYDETANPAIKELFKDAKEFILDIEKWWNLYDGFAIAKRIQAPPILSLSRRSLGYDHRETQEPPYYSEKYLIMRKKIMEM